MGAMLSCARVQVSTILSENSALVLDLFLSAYHCELVRSRALVEAEAGAATGRQQESPSRDALHRDATHGLAGPPPLLCID